MVAVFIVPPETVRTTSADPEGCAEFELVFISRMTLSGKKSADSDQD
jgi:hypothetical protein